MTNVEAEIYCLMNGAQNEDDKEIDHRKQLLEDGIINCNAFSEEMNGIIETQTQYMDEKESKLSIQRSSQLSSTHIFSGDVIPIDDISGVASLDSSYGSAEKILRCKLASLYRLVDLRGWSQGISNSITVRLEDVQGHEQFLINPHGLMFQEITASSLVKVDLEGNILDPGTSCRYGINPTGYVLHSTIHAARPDIRCIIQMQIPSCAAVSASTHGLLPLSQEAFIVGDVCYHDYGGGTLVDDDERKSLLKDLGPTNNVIFLRNHGIVCCGETIEEAFYRLYYTVLACEGQMKAMSAGIDNLILIPEPVYRRSRNQLALFDLQRRQKSENRNPIDTSQLLFEAYMRAMDTTGYRTGYDCTNPFVRSEVSL